MSTHRLNAYRIMWLFVFFDLPTHTKKDRKAASTFRKRLLKDGFTMKQYSVYIRHCASREVAKVHEYRVRKGLPAKGYVSILTVTDKQFSNIMNYMGKVSVKPPEKAPPQLEMF